MEFTLDTGNATYSIEAYTEDHIQVRGKLYDKPILVLPEIILYPWGPTNFDALTPEHFEIISHYKPQVVLLGTGKQARFPSSTLFHSLKIADIGIEIMSTPAACRTYTVLMAEGRHVAAALFTD